MANTPNSRKVALETAKDRREQLVDEQALKEIELSNAQTARERKQIQKELNALIKEEASIRARIALYEDKSVAAEKSIADSLQDQISTLKIKKNLSDKLSKSEDLQLRATKIIQSQLERGVITYEQAEDAVKKLNRSIRERLSIEEKTKKVLDASKESANAFLNDVSKGIGKLPVIGNSLSSGFNKFINSDAGKKVRDKLAEKMFDSKAIGKSLKGALGLGLVGAGIGIAGAGIKMTLATEQAMKDQQRSIGLANEQSNTADEMQRGLLLSTKSMVTNLEEARKATAELIDNFGTFATENSTLVDQQVNLTKAYGLQAEEASDFQRSAMISGQSTEEMKIAVLSTAAGFNKTTKPSFR
jgi:hypothetical protein